MTKFRSVGAPLSRAHEALLRRALDPLIAQAQRAAASVRTAAQARALGAQLREAWPDARLLAIVRAAGRAVEAAASRPWARLGREAAARGPERRDAAEYDGAALIDAWSREAAALIRSVRAEVAEGLRREIVEALEHGRDPAELAERWRARGIPVRFGTLEGRMRVIANHQIAVLHAKVQSERARSIGATHFVWRTQGDDRVRERHRALEGTRHAYDDPPSEGLPGTPVNCRCWAESILPEGVGAPGLRAAAARAGEGTPGATRRAGALERARGRLAARGPQQGTRPVPPRRAVRPRRREAT